MTSRGDRRRFHAAGATVAVWHVDAQVAAAAAAALAGSAHTCDVSSRPAVEAAAAEMSRATAASTCSEQRRRGHRRPVGDLRDADGNISIGITQTGVFLCSQAVGRHMLERGSGVIVNINSINAWDVFPSGWPTARPGAVVAMTEVLAIEWAGRACA